MEAEEAAVVLNVESLLLYSAQQWSAKNIYNINYKVEAIRKMNVEKDNCNNIEKLIIVIIASLFNVAQSL